MDLTWSLSRFRKACSWALRFSSYVSSFWLIFSSRSRSLAILSLLLDTASTLVNCINQANTSFFFTVCLFKICGIQGGVNSAITMFIINRKNKQIINERKWTLQCISYLENVIRSFQILTMLKSQSSV